MTVPPLPHLHVITWTRRTRDLFRLRYWIRCLDCDLHVGPFSSADDAQLFWDTEGFEAFDCFPPYMADG